MARASGNGGLFAALAIVTLLGVAAFALTLYWVPRIAGRGRVYVFAYPDHGVMVTIDARQPVHIARGEILERGLVRGEHTLSFRRGEQRSRHRLRIRQSGERWIVPVDDQCFVEIDATRRYKSQPGPPRLLERHQGHAAFRIGTAYLATTPAHRPRHESVHVMRYVPCDDLALPDDELALRHADR